MVKPLKPLSNKLGDTEIAKARQDANTKEKANDAEKVKKENKKAK